MAILLLRVFLAGVLLLAAITKLRDFEGSRQGLRDFGVPERFVPVGSVVLPIVELALAVGLLIGPTSAAAGAAVAVLFGVFTVVMVRLLRADKAPSCHCFGELSTEPISWWTVARNAVLALGAVIVAAQAPGREWDSLTGEEVAIVLLTTLAVASLIANVVLVRDNRRLRGGPQGRDYSDSGLEVGALAPDIAVESLDGRTVRLAEAFGDGPAVLIQVNPHCTPCGKLLRDMAGWRDSLKGQLEMVLVSTGDLDANQELAEQHRIPDLLRANGNEVSDAYAVHSTPSAVLVIAGRVTDPPALGAIAIESLIRVAVSRREPELQVIQSVPLG